MSVEDKARLAALEEENLRLKAEQAAFAEAEKKRAADARHAEHAAFAEGLVKEGKLLPSSKDVAVATLDYMGGQETVVEFGEGDSKKPLLDAFKEFLQAQPKQVEFGEVAGTGKGEATQLSDGEIAQRARVYKTRLDGQGENISFAEAVDAVVAGKDK